VCPTVNTLLSDVLVQLEDVFKVLVPDLEDSMITEDKRLSALASLARSRSSKTLSSSLNGTVEYHALRAMRIALIFDHHRVLRSLLVLDLPLFEEGVLVIPGEVGDVESPLVTGLRVLRPVVHLVTADARLRSVRVGST
jgi:hypothetical protein